MDLKNLKEFKEYTRIKKIDVRKWLLRGHAPLYTFILIVFAAAVVFMFSTIHSMFNNENTSDNPSDEVSVSTETTGYIADNQSYMLAINKSKNYLIVYSRYSVVPCRNPLPPVKLPSLTNLSGKCLIQMSMDTIRYNLATMPIYILYRIPSRIQ